jgi:hypothetical protein
VSAVFADGTRVRDAYSGKIEKVSRGKIKIRTDFDIVLLEKKINIPLYEKHESIPVCAFLLLPCKINPMLK